MAWRSAACPFWHPSIPPRDAGDERAARRRYLVRRLVALATFALAAAAVAYAALALTGGGDAEPVAAARTVSKHASPAAPRPRPVPREMRGVHVTMALAGVPGKLNAYTRLRSAGLNTIELDVKDENGDVAWLQDFSLGRTYTVDDLRAHVDAARSLSTRGFLLWNPVGV